MKGNAIKEDFSAPAVLHMGYSVCVYFGGSCAYSMLFLSIQSPSLASLVYSLKWTRTNTLTACQHVHTLLLLLVF